jgi:formylglycine-generating enzyme required for sulfatase activity
VNPVYLGPWLDALLPVRRKLTAPLAMLFRDKNRVSEHTQITSILANYALDEPQLMAGLLMDSDPKAFTAFFPVVRNHEEETLHLFQAEFDAATTQHPRPIAESVADERAQRQARAAAALSRLGKFSEIMPLLQHRTDTRLRSFIINWLGPLGTDPMVIAAELEKRDPKGVPAANPDRKAMDAILFNPETSIRRALILALGTFRVDKLPPAEHEQLVTKLFGLYRDDPDAGIHGATEWTLRKWGEQGLLKSTEVELMKLKDWGNRLWFINGQGQTFATIEGPVEFLMGSAPEEPDRLPDETLHWRRIPRRFAIAAKEVTVEQFDRFVHEAPQYATHPIHLERNSPAPDGPMITVSWTHAAAYCNWLSKQAGLPKDQWCYLPNEAGAYGEGMSIPADVLARKGYRLPTEAEWEYACRAGTRTSRFYGQSPDLLGNYAWYRPNSCDRCWPCGLTLPNDLGLFDMFGNVLEWCQDPQYVYPSATNTAVEDRVNGAERVELGTARIQRGGSCSNPSIQLRSAKRASSPPSRGQWFGFRIARTL